MQMVENNKPATASWAGMACLLFSLFLPAQWACAQRPSQLVLGRLQTGAQVAFTQSASGEWGIQITGGPAPRIVQPQPAHIEVYRAASDIRELATGYRTVRKSAAGIDALAEL